MTYPQYNADRATLVVVDSGWSPDWNTGTLLYQYDFHSGDADARAYNVTSVNLSLGGGTVTAPVGTPQSDEFAALAGMGGDDFLDGGAGSDTALFTGNRADYTIGRWAIWCRSPTAAAGATAPTTCSTWNTPASPMAGSACAPRWWPPPGGRWRPAAR